MATPTTQVLTTPVSTVTTSKQYSLNINDVLKGLLVAAISPIIPIILTSLNAGTFTLDWKVIGTTALGAGVAYLAKNFFTPAQTVVVPTAQTKTTTSGSL
jgi:hypothetical protein